MTLFTVEDNRTAVLRAQSFQANSAPHARHDIVGDFVGALCAAQKDMVGMQSISYRLALLFAVV
jgi:hypothetical protein